MNGIEISKECASRLELYSLLFAGFREVESGDGIPVRDVIDKIRRTKEE